MSHPLQELRGKMPYSPPDMLIDRYSFTGDILSYGRCSKQYGKFKHFGFTKALPIQAWFGDIVHMTIELLFRQVKGDIADASGTLKENEMPSDEDVEHHAEESMKALKTKGMFGRRADREFVVELLKLFNTREGLRFYRRIMKSEVRLETVIAPETEQRPYIMTGIIDVLASPTPGVIEIWDYKAMAKPPLGDPKLTSLENQMYNYVEIVQALFPQHTITTAVLYFINEIGPNGSGEPEHRIDLTDKIVGDCITTARIEANEIVERIRSAKAAGRFPDPPRGSVEKKTCDACEWRWHCTSTVYDYTLQAP